MTRIAANLLAFRADVDPTDTPKPRRTRRMTPGANKGGRPRKYPEGSRRETRWSGRSWCAPWRTRTRRVTRCGIYSPASLAMNNFRHTAGIRTIASSVTGRFSVFDSACAR
jgi:hypothetical protein